MATYMFALSTSDASRQAGLIQSPSFEEAVRLVGERMTVTKGDILEIGVKGFPPARYHCVEALLDGSVFWQPTAAELAA